MGKMGNLVVKLLHSRSRVSSTGILSKNMCRRVETEVPTLQTSNYSQCQFYKCDTVGRWGCLVSKEKENGRSFDLPFVEGSTDMTLKCWSINGLFTLYIGMSDKCL